MKTRKRIGAALACLPLALLAACSTQMRPARTLADNEIQRVMRREGVQGLAFATIAGGKVDKVRVFGQRNAALGQPLAPDTIMYGASLSKTAFAYLVLQLADEGKIDLDAPLPRLLPRPLPFYRERQFDYADLADEPRWKSITPRMLLMHSAGFANFRWLEPDERLRIHFEPGTRYAYSGEGYLLLQMVLEAGLGLDVGYEMQRRVFDRFAMTRTSMRWRPEFSENAAEGYAFDGVVHPHERRYRVRAAGSMDTTIADQAKLWAGIMRGEGLSPDSRAALVKGWLPITSKHQFPTLDGEAAVAWPQGLAAGLGVVSFRDRSGQAWFKGGHDEWTANMALCLEQGQRCVVFLSNDVRAEQLYPELARLALGETDMPWSWEYSDYSQP
ncbi:serine hydrolase domain-containing protein [Massilia phyllosphaerae]|uniref:serine hydrolase domain-containing protein n=1 Tax=Massilia phyllosphaerae TaxID=3106034 RepID=UPI002B1CC26A|nr:serine hydrolase domain-containing protein [Massilia sp. SGZ-792]